MADLAEADLGLTNMAMQTGLEAGNPRYIGDDTLLVKFYLHPKLDPGKTAEEGRPIYVEKEYVSIMIPGGRDCTVRPARQNDRELFRINPQLGGGAAFTHSTPMGSRPHPNQQGPRRSGAHFQSHCWSGYGTPPGWLYRLHWSSKPRFHHPGKAAPFPVP